MTKGPAKKTFSFGGCDFSKASPKLDALSPDTKMLNLIVSFEDSLKLNVAIQECVRTLNSYNRSTKAGQHSALNIALHLSKGRITVNETKL